MFRRRRREQAGRPGFDSDTAQDDPEFHDDPDELEDSGEDDDVEPAEYEPAASPEVRGSGPWDGAGSFPARERMDFGSLLVPAYEGIRVEVEMAESTGVCVTVLRGDSALQLMAFAAPKTSGLWDEVRQEFAAEVAKSGGDSREAQGPFGIELHARVHPAGEGKRHGSLESTALLIP